MNETSGRLGKINAVSGFKSKIKKFLKTTFLVAKLLEWKVTVKGICSSLFEADVQSRFSIDVLDTIEFFR